ncbi:MAG: YjbQ family protein [Candidatus Omnitrophica bacterium]|nr:YjbQ family protein [Candidatus Omnitrophota bacterium]
MEIFSLSTKKREEFIDITAAVSTIIKKQRVSSGICFIFCPHTTAALTINENADPSVCRDILQYLNTRIPFREDYSHLEGNSDAHIKASCIGSSVSVIIDTSTLQLGTWQGIYFCEFDGPRTRKVYVEIMSKE